MILAATKDEECLSKENGKESHWGKEKDMEWTKTLKMSSVTRKNANKKTSVCDDKSITGDFYKKT